MNFVGASFKKKWVGLCEGGDDSSAEIWKCWPSAERMHQPSDLFVFLGYYSLELFEANFLVFLFVSETLVFILLDFFGVLNHFLEFVLGISFADLLSDPLEIFQRYQSISICIKEIE